MNAWLEIDQALCKLLEPILGRGNYTRGRVASDTESFRPQLRSPEGHLVTYHGLIELVLQDFQGLNRERFETLLDGGAQLGVYHLVAAAGQGGLERFAREDVADPAFCVPEVRGDLTLRQLRLRNNQLDHALVGVADLLEVPHRGSGRRRSTERPRL